MKLKKFFDNITFKTKLFLSIGTLFLSLALIVCLLFSANAIQSTIKNDQSFSNSLLERICTQVSSLYEQMDIAATSLTKNPSLRSIVLELNSTDTLSDHEYLYQMQQRHNINTALGNMMFSPVISNVHLYNREKQYFYYAGNYYSDSEHIYNTLSSDAKTKRLIEQDVLYLPPANNPWTKEDRQVISVLRNFSDTLTTQNTVIEIQVPFRVLNAICAQKSFESEKEILILDSNNKIVYPLDSPTVLSENYISKICTDIQDGLLSSWKYNYSYYAHKEKVTGFTIVLISNNHTVHQQTTLYCITTLLSVMFIFFITLGITYILVARITQPLKELIHHIDELRLDSDTKFLIPTTTFNEFEILNASLNQMVTKLKSSISEIYELQLRESKANLAALQAQVDPHFLYNALNCISASSEIYDSSVTTQMCQKLSDMMRYVTSKQLSVTLIDEITHIKNFLSFMKISNGDNFDYTLEIAHEIHSLEIPKLSIQPFVENSFRHGFKNTMPPWYLKILCTANQNHWEIIIEDNGCGFSEKSLKQITSTPIKAADLEINGLGLNNTFSRLSLFLGEEFTYCVENLPHGSRIKLKGIYHNENTDC